MLAFFQLHPKHCIRQRFEDFCHDLYRLFLRHTDTNSPLLANFGYYHAAQANAKPRRTSGGCRQFFDRGANPGQNLRSFFGNRDRVLEMRTGLAVNSHHRPAIL
jgi:hypothetical protein